MTARFRPYFLKRYDKGFAVDPSSDDPTGIICPTDGCDEIVVYNGNYFCSCGWACPDPSSRRPEEQEFVNRLVAGLKENRRARDEKRSSHHRR